MCARRSKWLQKAVVPTVWKCYLCSGMLRLFIHILGSSACNLVCALRLARSTLPHARRYCSSASLRRAEWLKHGAGVSRLRLSCVLKEIWLSLMRGFSSATPAFNPPLTAKLRTADFDLCCPPDAGMATGSLVAMETSSLLSWWGNSSMFSLPTCSLMTYHSVSHLCWPLNWHKAASPNLC